MLSGCSSNNDDDSAMDEFIRAFGRERSGTFGRNDCVNDSIVIPCEIIFVVVAVLHEPFGYMYDSTKVQNSTVPRQDDNDVFHERAVG